MSIENNSFLGVEVTAQSNVTVRISVRISRKDRSVKHIRVMDQYIVLVAVISYYSRYLALSLVKEKQQLIYITVDYLH
jgi:hypothetical protein